MNNYVRQSKKLFQAEKPVSSNNLKHSQSRSPGSGPCFDV